MKKITCINSFPSLSPRLLFKKGNIDPIDNFNNIHFYSSGTTAVFHAIKALNLSPENNILMPSYHCGVEVDAAIKTGAHIKFYKIKRNFEIDLEDVENRIDRNTKALFIIHYYGFPQPVENIQTLCRKYRLYLIEDCAHALFSKYNGKFWGTFGNEAIFSIQKSLPVPNGGAFILKNSLFHVPNGTMTPIRLLVARKTILLLLDHFKAASNSWFNIVSFSFIKPTGLFLRMARKINPKSISSSAGSDTTITSLSISAISKRIIGNIDGKMVVEKRRSNYQSLMNRIKRIRGIKVCFPDLPEGVCPLFLPVEVKNRNQVQNRLERKKVQTFVFGKFSHKALPKDDFSDARFFSDHILSFPIHQNLENDHIEYIAQSLKDVSG